MLEIYHEAGMYWSVISCFPENSLKSINFSFWSEHCNEIAPKKQPLKSTSRLCQYVVG